VSVFLGEATTNKGEDALKGSFDYPMGVLSSSNLYKGMKDVRHGSIYPERPPTH
jgi:hypothetical protein